MSLVGGSQATDRFFFTAGRCVRCATLHEWRASRHRPIEKARCYRCKGQLAEIRQLPIGGPYKVPEFKEDE